MIWERELRRMSVSGRSSLTLNTTRDPEFYYYDQSVSENNRAVDYKENGGNDNDPGTNPLLKPHFLTIKTRNLSGALRALTHLSKETQGIIVLLCSDTSLVHVFRAAQKLRMLNGDYVFILVGPHLQVSSI